MKVRSSMLEVSDTIKVAVRGLSTYRFGMQTSLPHASSGPVYGKPAREDLGRQTR